MSNVTEITNAELKPMLDSNQVLLVDVREPAEHAHASIDGALLMPLGSLDAERIKAQAADKRVVFHCKAGGRSMTAATKYAQHHNLNDGQCHSLQGGIDAWASANMPTRRAAKAPPIDIMRQVQITAGSLVLIGVVLAITVHTGFIGISAFVGAGLVFAGASGWCGMAKLLGAMPWNKITSPKPA